MTAATPPFYCYPFPELPPYKPTIKNAKIPSICILAFRLLRRLDSNERPPGYEPGELPTAPLRDVFFLISSAKVRLLFHTTKFSQQNQHRRGFLIDINQVSGTVFLLFHTVISYYRAIGHTQHNAIQTSPVPLAKLLPFCVQTTDAK